MTIKLNATQRALLRATTQRGDQLIPFPDGRQSAAARKAADGLLAAGLAREIRARGDAPVWRRNEDDERAFALKLTAAGVNEAAGAVNDRLSSPRSPAGADGETEPMHKNAPKAQQNAHKAQHEAKAAASASERASIAAPRQGTKIDHVIKMLSQTEGATLEAMMKATGWLSHSTSAALTGLRKRGYVLERSRTGEAGPSVYRLSPSAGADA